MTMILDGASPRARSGDPTTSVDAGRSVDLCRSQTEVLAVFYLTGKPLADHELVFEAAKCGSRYSAQRIRSARSELVEAGFVREVEGEFRPGPTRKRHAHVWALC